MKIKKSNLPATSLLTNSPHNYVDSYSVSLHTRDLSIEQVCKAFFSSGPAWVDSLFTLRNSVVSKFGLKTPNSGSREAVLQNFKCEVGERVGLFKVFDKNESEVILGEDDKHLNFRVSLFLDKENNALVVSTIVDIHNWLGTLYFLPVKPFHKLIVPAMMKGMLEWLQKSR
ncbi:MAG: DUF2867 domain-containing protein [Chloroflexi bacterium]|nr:DUF2867 domain-containing protein [Chloroflexota bacterium]